MFFICLHCLNLRWNCSCLLDAHLRVHHRFGASSMPKQAWLHVQGSGFRVLGLGFRGLDFSISPVFRLGSGTVQCSQIVKLPFAVCNFGFVQWSNLSGPTCTQKRLKGPQVAFSLLERSQLQTLKPPWSKAYSALYVFSLCFASQHLHGQAIWELNAISQQPLFCKSM